MKYEEFKRRSMRSRDDPERQIEKQAERSEIKNKIKNVVNKRPEFRDFLEKHKVYGKFIKNTTENLERRSELDRRIRLNLLSIVSHPIDVAFIWRDTSQGHDFWRSLNNFKTFK